METYDRILKFDDDNMLCRSCFGKDENDRCREWQDEIGNYDTYQCNLYANADQISALIKEAESGYHWYHESGNLWVCECDTAPDCLSRIPHFLSESPVKCYKPSPYRGTKTEEKTWPGINGETHREALRELGLTAEDCSEVDLFVCDIQDCPNGLCNNVPRSYEEWEAADCDFIGLLRIENNKAVPKEESLQTKIERFSEPLKEESGEMGEEYVVLDDISILALRRSDLSDRAYSNFVHQHSLTVWKTGETYYRASDHENKWTDELEKWGFIEEKVEDYSASLGDCFRNDYAVFQASYRGVDNKMSLVVIKELIENEESQAGASYDYFNDASFSDSYLSDIVGKSRLKEFKPVKVKIEVVED